MSGPNAGLAYRVLDHIDAHPEQWNQADWWCGTSGCFAGWAVKLSGEDPKRVQRTTISDRAARLLGFTDTPAMDNAVFAVVHPRFASVEDLFNSGGYDDADKWELFCAENDREDLGRIVEAIFGPRPDGPS